MFIAKVVGKVISTQKNESLIGAKLLVIKSVDDKQQIIEEIANVAIDTVGAGVGDFVLVDWGSITYGEKKLSADMTIVGIVDEIQADDN